MKCMSCGANIPPEWIAAIKHNKCPGCDGKIFTDEAQELMTELATAMEQMPNNPQGIAGWLLSNYHIRKIGDAKPTEKFHTKQSVSSETDNNMKIAENPFLQRTNSYKQVMETQRKLNPNSQLAKLAQGITSVNADQTMYGSEDNAISPEDLEAMAQGQGQGQGRQLVAAGETFVDPNVQPLSPDELAVISSIGQEEDPQETQDVLNIQRMKRVKAQNAVLGGGGSFSRSD